MRKFFFKLLQPNIVAEVNKISIVNSSYSNCEIQLYHANHLENIISYALENSSYYQRLGLDKKSTISDFPLLNKSLIKENFDKILTVSSLNGLKRMSTSGSTGTPLVVYQNKDKVRRNSADFIYFYNQGGYSIGDKLYFLRAWENCKKNPIILFLTNMVMQETKNMSDKNIESFLNKLRLDKSKKSLWAYASSLTAITNYIGNRDLSAEINIKSIFSGSEALPDQTKEKLIKTFQCPVYSRYSSQEMGLLAQQTKQQNDLFTLNNASYYFEFLKLNSNEPVKEGELGRIVVTDLFNKAMPLLRYDTGDIGSFKYSSDGKKYLYRIDGRKTDFVYNTRDELISPHAVSMAMWKFNEIKQFQFIQKGRKEYKVLVNATESFNEELLINNMKRQMGEDAKISVEFIDEIPVLSSGKRRYIVNEMLS